MDCDVIVVGAGHNGLAASVLLAKHGLRVCVFEASESVGGLAGSGTRYGVMYDRFAYVAGLVDERIARVLGLDLEDVLAYSDPSWVEIYEGELYFRWWSRWEKLVNEVENVFGAGRGFSELMSDVEKAMECLWKRGLYVTPRPPSRGEAAETLARCERGLEAFVEESTRSVLSSYVPEELWPSLVYPVFYDSSGFVLAYFLQSKGLWFQPLHSMARLSTLLLKRAWSLNVEVYTSTPVERILVEKGVVRGVVLSDGRLVRGHVVLYAASVPALPKLLAESIDLLPSSDVSELEKIAGTKHYVSRIDVYVSKKPMPPREEGWKGIPLYSSWSRLGGGEVTYPTLLRGTPAGVHLIQFSGVLFTEDVKRVIDLLPGVDPGSIVDIEVRDWRVQERLYANPSGDPNHVPMTDEYLFDSRPLRGWGYYRTPIPCLYHGSASSYPGGQVTFVPGVNAALRILVDAGLRVEYSPIPRRLVEERALVAESWDPRVCWRG